MKQSDEFVIKGVCFLEKNSEQMHDSVFFTTQKDKAYVLSKPNESADFF